MMMTVNLSHDQDNRYISKTELGKNTSAMGLSSESTLSYGTSTEVKTFGGHNVSRAG